jgi:transcriptional regulator with XRE-family HTH domain
MVPPKKWRQDAFVASARGAWENLVRDLPGDAAARCPLGHYELDYALLGDFTRPGLADLLDRLRLAVAHHSGTWRQFWIPTRREIEPVPVDDTIQCWLGTPNTGPHDPGHVDFWRASPEGRMFLLRGYIEDGPDQNIEPGTIIDIREPIWGVAQCLQHARILGRLLAPEQDFQVLFRARWHGLAGRRLSSLDPIQAWTMLDHRIAQQAEFKVQGTFDQRQIEDNLPEIIQPLLAAFYERFQFFELTMEIVRQTLANLR